MSFNDQQSNEGGWQTVRRPVFGRQAQTEGMERPAFGRQAQTEGMGRPAFGRQAQTEGMERPAFGRQAQTEGMGRPAFGTRYGGAGRADAPSAFGGGNSERAEQRRQQEEARAAEAREKKAVEAAAAAKQAEAENFSSEVTYPSLGSAPSPSVPISRPAMNYKQVVKDMIAKEAETQLAAAAAAEEEAYAAATSFREPTRKAFIRQRILDELEEDYSGPEEDEEDDGEINADIGSGRRRGDKGIW